jgi:hypothetical protein
MKLFFFLFYPYKYQKHALNELKVKSLYLSNFISIYLWYVWFCILSQTAICLTVFHGVNRGTIICSFSFLTNQNENILTNQISPFSTKVCQKRLQESTGTRM